MMKRGWSFVKRGVLGRLCCGAALVAGMMSAGLAWGEAVPVQVTKTNNGWQMLRGGKPYFIKGGGGGGPKNVLAQCGGNSFRTWGVGRETQSELDEAQKLGLTVSLGIWLGHKQHGFNYSDAKAVQNQLESARKAVLQYKDHPALLVWSLGNEMEVNNDNPAVWNAIEEMAKMVKQLDPKHPTMTVVAEIGGKKLDNIKQYCPSIDIIGINTYGGGPSVAERYRKADVGKPYVITEFGPPGTWEMRMNSFGAPPELTSTEKAKAYRNTYVKSVSGAPGLCLGSYAFTWGFKIEATATWYGMFLPDQSKLAAVDTMAELWSGKAPERPCPEMRKLVLAGADQVAAGEVVKAAVEASDPQGDAVKIEWMLYREQGNYGVQGTGAKQTPSFPEAIEKNGQPTVTVKMPDKPGIYRLYCYLHNAHGGAAVGSLPIKVK